MKLYINGKEIEAPPEATLKAAGKTLFTGALDLVISIDDLEDRSRSDAMLNTAKTIIFEGSGGNYGCTFYNQQYGWCVYASGATAMHRTNPDRETAVQMAYEMSHGGKAGAA